MKWKMIIIPLVLALVFLMVAVTTAVAVTNPEKIAIIEKVLEYGVRGLEEYFKFLIEVLKITLSS